MLWTAGTLTLNPQPTVAPSLNAGPPLPPLRATLSDERLYPGWESHPEPVLLVTFWASWCTTCMAELPKKIELASAHPNALHLVAISLDHDLTALQTARTKLPPAPANSTWLQQPNPTDLRTLGVRGVPETFLLDAQRRVLAKATGPVSLQHGAFATQLDLQLQNLRGKTTP